MQARDDNRINCDYTVRLDDEQRGRLHCVARREMDRRSVQLASSLSDRPDSEQVRSTQM